MQRISFGAALAVLGVILATAPPIFGQKVAFGTRWVVLDVTPSDNWG